MIGIAQELQGIDLGDERLNRRACRIGERLAADPQASINMACADWNETFAAYRFFDNATVTPQKILEPHVQATHRRIEQQSAVLIVQDTTDLCFGNHPAKDSRCLDKDYRLGLYDHTHAAFSETGEPLGILDVKFFDRDVESLGKTRQRRADPIEDKESYRWLEGIELAEQVAQQHRETEVISVSDSEADIYEIYRAAFSEGRHSHCIIRAKQIRRTLDIDQEKGGKNYVTVLDQLLQGEPTAMRIMELPRTPKREARQATLNIFSASIEVQPPAAHPEWENLTLNFVLVDETGRPENDETAVRWLLITTLPIDSVRKTLRVVDGYVGRWPIEPYFRTFKTGCRVEEIQLETTARRKRCLMFYKVIAWKIMQVTYQGRAYPSLCVEDLFPATQWKPVWRVVRKRRCPSRPPSLKTFIAVLASLGGYNNRPSEGPPGPEVMWTAMRKMLNLELAWVEFGPDTR